jgi:uncharacterized repeat protein (TIGR01451 family)/uncharacterized delta-60 repeat protein
MKTRKQGARKKTPDVMFTFHDKILKQAGGFLMPLCLAAAFYAGTAGDVQAQPAAANSVLANAQVIFGPTGRVTGTNVNATLESSQSVFGAFAGAPIWYEWTAPYTATIDFSTRGSTDPLTGDPLDTVLIVWALTNSSLAFSNLSLQTFNEDDPSGGVTSRVDFPVIEGSNYLIEVLGSTNNPTSTYKYAEGHVVLNWAPSLVGGTFAFSTPVYFAGEYDDYLAFNLDYEPNSIDQSLANPQGDPNIRVTVSRQGGFTGKCHVTLSMTNVTYTNLFQTNYQGTNIYITNYSTNIFTPANVTSFTNTYLTNVLCQNTFTNYVGNAFSNGFQGFPQWNLYQVTLTNFNPTGAGPGGDVTNQPVANTLPLTGLGLTNFFTNYPCENITIAVTNTNSPFSITVTQIFCLGSYDTNGNLVPAVSTNRVTPSASNGLDYVNITTNMTFNDFQMSQDVYLTVDPNGTLLTGPDWPDANGNFNYFGINSLVQLSLSNPVLDPGEDQNITPPTISGSQGNAYLDILNYYCNAGNYWGGPMFLVTNTAPGDHVTINLERATWRTARVPNGSNPTTGTNAYLYAVLAGPAPADASYTVHYAIDCEEAAVPWATVIPIESFDWHRFPTAAGSDYAVPSYYTNEGVTFPDFGVPVNDPFDPSLEQVGDRSTWPAGAPYQGSITIGPFNPGEPYGEIAIPILTNGAVEFDVDMDVQLFEMPGDVSANQGATVPGFIGNIPSANLTIQFTGQPGGAYDTSFNLDNVSTSYPPDNTQPGALGGSVGAVHAIAIQTNGQAVIGGLFFSYNTTPVYSIARLLTNGLMDDGFNAVQQPGVNYGGTVNAIAIDSSGRIIIGGSFTSYDGTNAENIARLNYNGSLDTNFKSGIGFNRFVNALAIDAKGNILVGGDFTSYNTTNCNHIARLLPNGGLDPAFLPNTGNGLPNYGTDRDVEAVATDGNGNIILGGEFGYVNGSNISYVARLLPGGALDPSFVPEIGPDYTVHSIAIQPNNEILIGGAFQNYNLVSRSGIALIAYNGALDTAFVPGSGADGVVYSVVIQPTNGDLLVGGQFRNFNTSRRMGVARLLPNGWVDTSFMDTSYNQFAGLISKSFSDPVNIAYALALQSDGNILVGGSFTNVGGGSTRDAIHNQENITRLIGAPTPGPMSSGGGLSNCPGNITLTQNPYTVMDTGNSLFITLLRTNGSLGPAQVTLDTNLLSPGPGAATAADFGLNRPATALYNIIDNVWGSILPFGTYGWRECDGLYGYNTAIQPDGDFYNSSFLKLTIYNDPTALQNLFANLSLLNASELNISSIQHPGFGPLVLGGVVIPTYPALGLPGAELEIVNNNFPPGLVGFSATNYTALDTSNSVTLTVLRTNGQFGNITLYYCTADGSAENGVNYTGSPSNTPPSSFTQLTLQDGQTSATFTIPIILQSAVRNTTQFYVSLYQSSPSGVFDTNVPPFVYSNATVTIIDGNYAPGHLSFTSPTYNAEKGGAATVGVMRSGGAVGELKVQCAATNGTGTNGLNFTGVTNTLSWGDQDVSVKTMTVQTLQDNIVEGNKTVNLSLFNATNIGTTNSASAILTSPSNAVLTIQEVNAYGGPTFVVPNFNVMQNAGQALITIIRTNGTTGTLSVNYATFNDTGATNLGPSYQPALAGTNYGAVSGALTFHSGQTSTNFVVPIYYTPGESNAANRMVTLELFNASPVSISNQFATLTILDPGLVKYPAGNVDPTTLSGAGFNNVVNSLALQPDGSVLAGGAFTFFNQYPFNYVGRLEPSGAFDSSFLFNQAGANGSVLQVLSQTPGGTQTNGPVMIVGNFTQVDAVNRGGIARLNLDGSVDETFNPGSGADSTIFAFAEASLPSGISNQPSSLAYYIGGNFANYNGVPSGGIARLNASTNSPGYQGSVDPDFNVGQGVTGSDAAIHALAVQANGQVVLGGDFTSFNSQPYNHLVRLNVDGSIDTGFNPNTNFGPSDSVRAIAIQPDGQILIGGFFTNVGGSNLNYLARLNSADGSVDTNFNVGVGGNDVVLALAIDSQTRILVGGEFTRFSGVTRSGITRLNPDGTVDPTINFGTAADGGFVGTIAIQNNDEIDVGGGFATFEGVAENNFVRLFGGANLGNGSAQFTQPVFGVLENGTNAVITIQRFGGEGTNALTTSSILFSTSDGTALAGSNYTAVSTNVVFPLGETFESVTIPIINNYAVGGDMVVNLNLSDPTNLAIGDQPSAILIITNFNSAVSFSAPAYRQAADAPGGNAIIPVVRIGNSNTTVGVTVYTGSGGTATPNVDYIPTTNFIVFNPGVMTNYFLVPMLNPAGLFGDQTVNLGMINPSNTIPASPTTAILTIAAVYGGPGVLAFSQPSYSIVAPNAGMTNEIITIVRTNGSSNSVAVTLTTSDGTAVAGIQYTAVQTNVYFAEGVTSQTVSIPVDPQPNAGPATTVYLTLSNPQYGATIGGAAQEVLTILNGVESFAFTNLPYVVTEGSGTFSLDIVRNGPANEDVSVNYTSFSQPGTPPGTPEAEGYAQPNIDYAPISGTLSFPAGVTYQTIPITILQATNVNEGPIIFQVDLTSNLNSGAQLGTPSVAPITINCDVTGFAFSATNYVVGENGGSIVISVQRYNPDTGVASVQFATSDGSALSRVDYASTNGTLIFPYNQATASFSVPILNRDVVEGNKTFNVTLSNPLVTPVNSSYPVAYLVTPSIAQVTITNVLTGVSFGSPTYSVSECGVTAAIPVVLVGATNNPVTVSYTTTNGGSAVVGVNYQATNGTLTFPIGQTNQTIYVQVINNHIVGPNHTVYLALSNPTNAVLLNPSTAVLTIQECNAAFIVNSGTAFVSGSVANNFGVIFPNEIVTILFGLRDISVINATGVVATLLPTSGVVPIPAGESQPYPPLIANGPTVSMPFKFEAVGTNGQNISAGLVLTEGTNVFTNYFGFTLGGTTTFFSTNETLLMVGSNPPPSKAFGTNAPNYGYPSIINVSGLVGVVTAVTAGISNFGHTSPGDVAVVLESPAPTVPRQGTILMDDCGGSNNAQNLNLTFSQSAGSSLPESTPLASGTYLPTDYGVVSLPATTVNQTESAPTSFSQTLASFVGQSPNGIWSLFVADEAFLDHGYISNGWSLSISTGSPVESDSDLELGMTVAPAAATLGNILTYSISVTNYGPAVATGVIITDTLPSGVTNVTSSSGTNGLTNGVFTFTVATLAVSNGVTFNIELVPTSVGYITNIAVATASEPDLNVNYAQTNVMFVSVPSADLGVTLSGSPNPVLDGANVTYTIVVTNSGPSTATGVMATNALPSGFLPVTITPATTNVATNADVTVIWNVGTMTNGSSDTLTLVAAADLPESGLPSSFLDQVFVGSQVIDPAKLNNYAAIKTEVDPAMLTLVATGDPSYMILWPAVAGNLVLEGTVTLAGPWKPIANPAAVGGIYSYVLPGTNGYHFFRLVSQLP